MLAVVLDVSVCMITAGEVKSGDLEVCVLTYIEYMLE